MTYRDTEFRRLSLGSTVGLGASVLLLALLLVASEWYGGNTTRGTGQAASLLLCLLLCLLPLAVSVLLGVAKKEPALIAEPGLMAAISFAVFFGAGLIEYSRSGQTVAFLLVGSVPWYEVTPVVLGCSLITTAFVIGSKLGTKPASAQLPDFSSVGTQRIFVLSQFLFTISLLAAIATVISFGSVSAAMGSLLLHNRDEGIGATGLAGSVWLLFALPACASLFANTATRPRRARRVIILSEAAILACVAVGLYGSRLTVILAMIAFWFTKYAATSRGTPARVLLVVVVGIALMSGLVLGLRADAQAHRQGAADQTILGTFGYSIFDVTVAGSAVREQLSHQLDSPHRSLVALSSVLPGSGRRSLQISNNRVDVIFVKAIGTEAQAQHSGLPPSLPGFLFVGFGTIGGCIISLGCGLLAGWGNGWLLKRRNEIGCVFYGLWGAFIFNAVKGGDLPLDLGSEIRRWLYLVAIYGAICLVIRERNKA